MPEQNEKNKPRGRGRRPAQQPDANKPKAAAGGAEQPGEHVKETAQGGDKPQNSRRGGRRKVQVQPSAAGQAPVNAQSGQNAQKGARQQKPGAKAQNQNAEAPAAEKAQNGQQRRQGGRRRADKGSSTSNGPIVRIIPLGGLGEVGKNITVFECGGDALIVDCGLAFPDESMPGVDLVIPDFTYVLEIKDKIRGIVITHGHEDHIGSLSYLLKQAKFPIYGTRLTLGLVENRLKEHGLLGRVQLNVVKSRDVVRLGCMNVEFIGVNHSIPDSCALAIHTPAGVIVHSGDFKVDYTPIRSAVIDLARFGELGSQGVLALLSDSTNAERPGISMSERTVGDSFSKLFGAAAKKRIIIATFASNVHRVQQIVDAAVEYKRKVAFSGRSMENVVNKSLELGYLDIPSGVLVDVDSVNKYPADKMVIVTTGSQGEPMSALTRMAMGDHRKVTVNPNDYIIISANPIPGNEKLVTRVINELLKLGADVVYERMYDIHVSGHACQEEQKMLLALTRPKFFVPVHGEYKHLKKHAATAQSMGIDAQNILVPEIGRVIETDGKMMRFGGTVHSGQVFVDGLGVGDVGSIVLRDRKHLAQDGLIIVVTAIDTDTGQILAGPDIVSRGFVYVRESEDMIVKARDIARGTIQKCIDNNTREWGVYKQRIKDDVGEYLWQMTKRNPMILPVIQEV